MSKIDDRLRNILTKDVDTMVDSSMEDSFEGIYESGREITVRFNFMMEGYLYMPTTDSSIIRKIFINYYDLNDPETMIDQTILDESDAPEGGSP